MPLICANLSAFLIFLPTSEGMVMLYLMHHFQMMKEYWQQLHGIKTFSYGMYHQELTGCKCSVLTSYFCNFGCTVFG